MTQDHASPASVGALVALVVTTAFWPDSANTQERDEICAGLRGTALWGQCTRAVENGCHESELAHPRCEQWAEIWADDTGVSPPWVSCDEKGSCTVFVTSALYNANLGGLQGADEKCQVLARRAGLGGSFKAWLSASGPNNAAADRLHHASVDYVLVGGETVAEGWDELTSCSGEPNDECLQHPIDQTEDGGEPPVATGINARAAYTGTDSDGSLAIGFPPENRVLTCQDWTIGEATENDTALFGEWERLDGLWTSFFGSQCGVRAPLYCFEQ